MRLAILVALMILLAGCATRDIDECEKGDRRRCPGTAFPGPDLPLARDVAS